MRSPLWFVVAGLIAIAGFVAAYFYLMPRVSAADAQMMRVVVPGEAELVLDKPGIYTIFHEKKSTVDGRYYASDTVDGLSLTLIAESTGAPVKLLEPKMSSSYEIGNRSGASIFSFALDQPGRYRLIARLAGDRRSPEAVLAISRGAVGVLLGAIFGTIAIAFAGLGLAGIIVIVVLWRRSTAAKPVASG
jgi:hypothetical protein